jgi:3-dehydroquinate dehydratase-2
LEELNRNIAIINGPNLNLLGSREKEIYGEQSFDVYLNSLSIKYHTVKFCYYQSNVEGELVSKILDLNVTELF